MKIIIVDIDVVADSDRFLDFFSLANEIELISIQVTQLVRKPDQRPNSRMNFWS